MKFKPIKPKRISDQIYDQIRELIFKGQLKPGEKLMPERELASIFNVSRPSVREAVNKLISAGLIEQYQGQGTFVSFRNGDERSRWAVIMSEQEVSLEDLLEFRMMLECNAASMAAEKADQNDIEMLDKCIADTKSVIESGSLGTEASVTFHMTIAYATKNPVQVYVMRDLYDYMSTGIEGNRVLMEDAKEKIELLEHHEMIVDSIKKRDPQKAFEAMKNHLSFVLEHVKLRTQK